MLLAYYLRIYYQHNPDRLSACPLTIRALLHIAAVSNRWDQSGAIGPSQSRGIVEITTCYPTSVLPLPIYGPILDRGRSTDANQACVW